jgi:hypothetical protein
MALYDLERDNGEHESEGRIQHASGRILWI